MASTTTNLGLTKPAYSDDADISDINGNMDLIDAEAGRVRANVAANYDSSETYAVGDYCLHDGSLYKCSTAISSPEAWTAGHWTQIKITGELSALNGKLENYNGITLTPAENVTIDMNKTETIIAGRLVFMKLYIDTTATKPAWAELVLTSINVNQTPARMFNGGNLTPLTTTVYMENSKVRLSTDALPTGSYVIEVIAIKG